MSTTSILEKACRVLRDHTARSASHLKLRRSPEQRKKDWQTAMSGIAFEEGLDGSTAPHAFPVLDSILNLAHVQQALDMKQIPLTTVRFPPRSVELASVWTYVAFLART